MLFNSLEFFLFFPAVLALFAIVPERQRWLLLLVASYFFYAATGLFNLIYLGGVTLLVYGCGVGIGRSSGRISRKSFFVLGLIVVLGGLAGFKFYDFAAGEVERLLAEMSGGEPHALLPRIGVSTPVGFSFYAFMAASYLIDVYTGRLSADRNAGRLALYVSYFPKILAGPIERATAFLPQASGALCFETSRFVSGLQLIGWGLIKKVLIADNLAPVVDRAFGIAAYATPMDLLVATYFFAFQIYCDFSGYADIAIGVSLIFGIRLMENFRRPYLSRTTAEFWSARWHISLGHWFRDYLYIPLGGSRAGQLRQYLNIMAVFVISGLWHAGLGYGVGWSFLVWGALNGLYQWFGIATRGVWRRIGEASPRLSASLVLHVGRVLLTFHLILVAWVFFRAKSVEDALTILSRIWAALPDLPALIVRYPFAPAQMAGAGLITALIVIEVVDERQSIWQRLGGMPVAVRWALYYAGIFVLLLAGRWQAREFIYMQF